VDGQRHVLATLPLENNPAPTAQEADWAPGRSRKISPIGIRSSEGQTLSEIWVESVKGTGDGPNTHHTEAYAWQWSEFK
jgi:hypothetical protein